MRGKTIRFRNVPKYKYQLMRNYTYDTGHLVRCERRNVRVDQSCGNAAGGQIEGEDAWTATQIQSRGVAS